MPSGSIQRVPKAQLAAINHAIPVRILTGQKGPELLINGRANLAAGRRADARAVLMPDHPVVALDVDQWRETTRERATCTPVDMAGRDKGTVKVEHDLRPVLHGALDPTGFRLTGLPVIDMTQSSGRTS